MSPALVVLALITQWPASANLADVGSVADPTGYLKATSLTLGLLPVDYRAAGYEKAAVLQSTEQTHADGTKYLLVVREGNLSAPGNGSVTIFAYRKPSATGFSSGTALYSWDLRAAANTRAPLSQTIGLHMLWPASGDVRYTLSQ